MKEKWEMSLISFRINKAVILASKINSQKSSKKKSKQLIYNYPVLNYSRKRTSGKHLHTNTCSIAWTLTVWTSAHPTLMESSVRNLNHQTGLEPKFQKVQEGSVSEEAVNELHQWLDIQICQQSEEISKSFKFKETALICVYLKVPTKSLQWMITWNLNNKILFVLPKI